MSGVVIGALSTAILLVAAMLVGMMSGLIPIGPAPSNRGNPATAGPTVSATSPSAVQTPTNPTAAMHLIFSDPLTQPLRWTDSGTAGLGCTITSGGLQVVAHDPTSYRCKGPVDRYVDLDVSLAVQLLTPNSCASIWFRYDDLLGGYALRICADNLDLVYHRDRQTEQVRRFVLDPPRQVGVRIPVRISVIGTQFHAYIGENEVGYVQVPVVHSGRMVLGIFENSDVAATDFKVLMANISLRQP
jgi:hypothetical protein